MTLEPSELRTPDATRDAIPYDRHEDAVWLAMWLGLVLAVAGVVDGLAMAVQRDAVTCPDGAVFAPDATDFACFAHPQAGLGIAIAVIAAMLGVVIVLVSITARASLRRV